MADCSPAREQVRAASRQGGPDGPAQGDVVPGGESCQEPAARIAGPAGSLLSPVSPRLHDGVALEWQRDGATGLS